MESLQALGLESIGVPFEIRKTVYYMVILFACLSVFQRFRWSVLFVIRAVWILGFECWINYFLVYNYNEDWSDATLRRVLGDNVTRTEREPMDRAEWWYRIWGYKTRKQMIRERHKDMDKETEDEIWYRLVVPEGKDFPCDKGEPCGVDKLRKRKSWGVVESVAQPVKQYPGAIGGHDNGTVRRGSGQSSVRGGDTAEEEQSGQSGHNGSIGKKEKKNNRKRR